MKTSIKIDVAPKSLGSYEVSNDDCSYIRFFFFFISTTLLINTPYEGFNLLYNEFNLDSTIISF